MPGRSSILIALVVLLAAPVIVFAQNGDAAAPVGTSDVAGDEFSSFAQRLANGEKVAPGARVNEPIAVQGSDIDASATSSNEVNAPINFSGTSIQDEISTEDPVESMEAEMGTLPPPSHSLIGSGTSSGGEETASSSYLSLGGNDWILQTLTALGIVLALIFLLRWLWMKMTGQVSASSNAAVVEVLSRTTIAPKNHVVLLRVAGRILVCNDSGQGMTTLSTIDDPHEIATILAEVSATKSSSISRSFTDLMQRFNGDYESVQSQSEGTDAEEYSVDHTRNQLSGLLSRLRTAGTE